MLLVGPPGGGKSTLATQLAGSAARHVVVLYLACEEGHSVTLAERLERQQLDDLARRRLRVSDARMIAEVEEDLAAAGDARVVVIDSISELRCSPVWLTEAMRGRTWIGVVHANARGTGKYASDHEHAADVVVDVEQGVATPRKNRFGGMAPLPVWSQEVKK